MGALGFGIFDDDHACDIRNTYRDLISLGASETDCTAELVRCFVTNDSEDDHANAIFWLAVALLQHQYGRPVESVKQRALELIDSGRALELWSELAYDGPASIERRASVLKKAKAKLLSPVPAPKKLRPSKELKRRMALADSQFPWGVDELYSYQLESGEFVILACVKIWEDRVRSYRMVEGSLRGEIVTLQSPVLLLLDYKYPEPPSEKDAQQASPLVSDVSEEEKEQLADVLKESLKSSERVLLESYASFRQVRPEPDEAYLREVFTRRQQLAQGDLEMFSDIQAAIRRELFKLFWMRWDRPVPRQKIRKLQIPGSFSCQTNPTLKFVGTDWEQLESSATRWREKEAIKGLMSGCS